jgi:hypothetical protein
VKDAQLSLGVLSEECDKLRQENLWLTSLLSHSAEKHGPSKESSQKSMPKSSSLKGVPEITSIHDNIIIWGKRFAVMREAFISDTHFLGAHHIPSIDIDDPSHYDSNAKQVAAITEEIYQEIPKEFHKYIAHSNFYTKVSNGMCILRCPTHFLY